MHGDDHRSSGDAGRAQVGLEEPAPALDLAPAIAAALAVLPPAPPLTELAAVNPLAGLDHLPFATAAHEAARLFRREQRPSRSASQTLLRYGRIRPYKTSPALN